MRSRWMLMTVTVTVVLATCLGCAEAVLAQSDKEITNSIGMKLVLIPKGTFMMGSPESEEGRSDDESQHEVTLSKDFYLGVTEVTQGQYEMVMGNKNNPSYFQKRVILQGDSSMHPVEQVTWEETVAFCERLSQLPEEKEAGRVYRLPTEAEWEYGCRAGSKTAFGFEGIGRDLVNHAWFGDNSGTKEMDVIAFSKSLNDDPRQFLKAMLSAGCTTHPVGEKKPNAWGLYDMHGNVWERCSDWYTDYPKGAVTDPVGPSDGARHLIRGGCWVNAALNCRSAFREACIPSGRSMIIGFRVAMSPPSGIPN
jgi:formylglycine-generating enzyme required for sulfatase activity